MDSSGKKNNFNRIILFLAIFGISFGYIEGTVAHYLRLHYYPGGFSGTVRNIDTSIMIIEMIREFSTIVILGTIAYLSVTVKILRYAYFVFCFAVWDIVYYITLYIINGWPKTLLDWDVLFLIPVPWFAPVLAPVIISLTGVLNVILINRYFARNNEIRISLTFIMLIAAAFVLWIITFISHPALTEFPAVYDWNLFILGLFACLSASVNFMFTNKYPGSGMFLKSVILK